MGPHCSEAVKGIGGGQHVEGERALGRSCLINPLDPRTPQVSRLWDGNIHETWGEFPFFFSESEF